MATVLYLYNIIYCGKHGRPVHVGGDTENICHPCDVCQWIQENPYSTDEDEYVKERNQEHEAAEEERYREHEADEEEEEYPY